MKTSDLNHGKTIMRIESQSRGNYEWFKFNQSWKMESKREKDWRIQASSSSVEFINFDDFFWFLHFPWFLMVFSSFNDRWSFPFCLRRHGVIFLSNISHRYSKYLQRRVADWGECHCFGDVGRAMLQLWNSLLVVLWRAKNKRKISDENYGCCTKP